MNNISHESYVKINTVSHKPISVVGKFKTGHYLTNKYIFIYIIVMIYVKQKELIKSAQYF